MIIQSRSRRGGEAVDLQRNIHATSVSAGLEGSVEGDGVWMDLMPQTGHVLQQHQSLRMTTL